MGINTDYLYEGNDAHNLIRNTYAMQDNDSYTRYDSLGIYTRIRTKDLYEFNALVDTNSGVVVEGELYNGDENELSYDKFICSDEKVIYIGVIRKVWGHFITDAISRLWFLQSDEYIKKYKNYKIVFVPGDRYKDSYYPNCIKLFRIVAGIDMNECVPITKPTIFKEVIVPDCSFWEQNGIRFYNENYVASINKARLYAENSFVSDIRYKKTYFKYVTSVWGKNNSEKLIEKFFKDQGFTIVSPGEITLEKMLNILLNCEHFASTVGSCAHNSVFLRNRTRVTLIPRDSDLDTYQNALLDVNEADAYYVHSSLSSLVNRVIPTDGPFCFIISKELLRYFNIEKEITGDFWKKSLKYYMRYKRREWFMDNYADRIQPLYYERQIAYYEELRKKATIRYKIYISMKTIIKGLIKREQ